MALEELMVEDRVAEIERTEARRLELAEQAQAADRVAQAERALVTRRAH